MKTLRTLMVSTILLTGFQAQTAFAQDDDNDDVIALFDDMIVFGDSLSDPGNLPGILGGFNFPGAPYFENQFSNGPVYAYLVDDLLGFQASRDLNFAVGGARSGPGVTQNGFGVDHVNAFLNGNGSGAQIDRYLATNPTVSPFDLFVLNIAGNDYLGYNPAVDDANLVVSNAVGNIESQINILTGAGAQHIIVPFVADTGLTPSVSSQGAAAVAAGSAISDAHNFALSQMLSDLTQTSSAHIYVIDSTSLLRDVANNPAKYGLTNVTDSCFSGGVVCANPNEFLFFDGVHPTAIGHQITAAAMADTILSTRTPGATAEVSARMAQDWDHMLSVNARTLNFTNDWSWFGQVHYLAGERDNQRMSLGYEYDGYAATLGGAKTIGKYNVGLAASYGLSETDYEMVDGGLETDSIRLGGFVARDFDRFTATVTGSVSFDAHDLERDTNVADQEAEATTEGRTFFLSGELRGNFIDTGNDDISVHPFARLTVQDTKIEAYGESGAVALDRLVDQVKINPINAELGLDVGGKFDQVFVGAQASWVEGLEDDSQTYTTALVTVPNVPVTITTLGTDSSYARLSGMVGYNISDNLNIALVGSSHILRDDAEAMNGMLRVSGKF